MGEAKRRKARDPTYGRPKRGLVVSPPVEIQGSTLRFLSQLDPQELRFALLFWDKLVWPKSRSVYIASGPDESFLEQAGILGRPEYTFSGVAAPGLARTQIQAFLDLDRREPGVWSLAQGEDSFLLKDRILTEGNGAFVELHRAIPVPDKDVPLDDILRFRDKRSDELQLLRHRIDIFVASINDSGESGILRNFGLGGKAEGFHFSDVLSFHDEFREDIGWGRIQEKFRQALA
jgi:hypothetical protein